MAEYEQQAEFTLGTPALVCRWRLRDGALALKNRHVRALSRRRLATGAVTPELAAWVKQHLEWTLDKTSAPYVDGVLMLVVDEGGKAAMAGAPYEPLADVSLEALLERARASRTEEAETGVAPEVLVAVKDGELVLGLDPVSVRAGAVDFLAQLAQTMGIAVRSEAYILDELALLDADEVFLASDEHGVVAADGLGGPVCEKLADAYGAILADAAKRRR